MRLLNVNTLEFRVFDRDVPAYATASHRWQAGSEATIGDLQNRRNTGTSGYKKVKSFARYVRKHFSNIHWLWIDTCCVNQDSMPEVDEAVNSMFRWYAGAEVCIAYLADVPSPQSWDRFEASVWFKRGWTLQELLAPPVVLFVSSGWEVIGHESTDGWAERSAGVEKGPALVPRIAEITKIPEEVLYGYSRSKNYTIEERLAWMDGRDTTKSEDKYYSMLGIFDVRMRLSYGETAEVAKQRLLKKIAKSAEMTGTMQAHPVARCHYLPLLPNHKFVGRSVELEMLERKLFTEQDCHAMAVVGLGGIGKTQVVLQYAYSVKGKHPEVSVFWVPALSEEMFEQAYSSLAKTLGINVDPEQQEDVKELLQRHLGTKEAGKWLLVVDNADDLNVLCGAQGTEGLVRYLPQSQSGRTVFTTRNRLVAQRLVGSDVMQLGNMDHAEAVEVLKHALHQKDLVQDEGATTKLLHELEYLPLAITQAAAYINCHAVSLVEYLECMQSTEQDLVYMLSQEMGDSTRYQQSKHAVATTWLVSFTQIVEKHPDAADLLRFMSCIEWRAIPASLLPRMQPVARMTTAIGALCSYSFVTKRGDGHTYDMHRLVHVAARIWIEHNGMKPQTQVNAIQHISEVFPLGEWEDRALWRAYFPHVSHMRKDLYVGRTNDRGLLCMRVGICLVADGRSREAVRWSKESSECYRDFPEDHPDRLASELVLALAYKGNGQIEQAVQLLEHVVTTERGVLPEDHLNLLASQRKLAGSYLANRQIKKAVQLLEHVVTTEKGVLAEDHPDRLISQYVLARAYLANGQLEEAKRLLEHVVASQTKVLAKDHPDRLESQYMLARAYQLNGQSQEAVRLLDSSML
ncbi:hypothetical protein BAUCODRAFT_79185 [Baudoinia panamericana UAMH 10762]|uniref:Heterokaryon incompatibility domain-containing protein n=1 Tax=Baudoinia panamericana (strain UAMH 10762) TaxID=717646 RepID=M2N004_BAUPA|nr:uncharacterized protein BAUCODRAFT_79185 [Baudoinia panamericana UAMH 10762]EMC91910.1 hypothetical protein BAUCODRAFT_79185 [Baudoinia panamericana UAMH 10762]